MKTGNEFENSDEETSWKVAIWRTMTEMAG
jgi:hypothetical protein